MHMKQGLFIVLFMLIPVKIFAGKTPVTVYAYHLKPPFIVNLDKKTGLYFDFSEYMNDRSESFYFTTEFRPKKRLGDYIKKKIMDGLLIGVNPIWYGDKNEKKYLWTSSLYNDQDEMISRSQTRFNYTGPESLIGKRLGGVLGFFYHSIGDLVDSGKINRDDALSEEAIMKKLLSDRIDVGIVSRSTFDYFIKRRKKWVGKFYVSPKPHDVFERRIMIIHKDKAVYDEIAPIVDTMMQDPEWIRIINSYK